MLQYLDKLVAGHPRLNGLRRQLEEAHALLLGCIRSGGKILVCGNGGSAADAEHIVGELMKGFLLARPLDAELRKAIISRFPEDGGQLADSLQGAVPAVSLVAGVALPTAFANDVNSEYLFAQELLGLARPGDVLWAISTSGNSRNVIHALRLAKVLGCRTLGLTGRDGGAMAALLDVELRVPSRSTPEIQEFHLPIYHALCAELEAALFAEGSGRPIPRPAAAPSGRDSAQMAASLLPAKIELIVFDFDGVFTDNGVLTDQDGREMVRCDRGDGLGIDMLRRRKVPMCILSTEANPVVSARAAKLGLPVVQSCRDKAAQLKSILAERGIGGGNVIYVGNDLNDLDAMALAGCPVAPADAHPAVRGMARIVLHGRGGTGAVRELCDLVRTRLDAAQK